MYNLFTSILNMINKAIHLLETMKIQQNDTMIPRAKKTLKYWFLLTIKLNAVITVKF